MPKVTLCAIMLNEEQFLPTFLENIKDVFQEYIFVDGGSVDRSIDIVKAAGYSVTSIPFDMDFAKQKNNALMLATNKWRMFLDIDETMSRGVKDFLRGFATQANYFHATAFFRDNFLDGGGQDDSPLDFPIRFFDEHIYYEGAVHEMPVIGQRTLIRFFGGRLYHRKDSFRQYRANLLYELIRRSETKMPDPTLGAFNENGRLRLVKLNHAERSIALTNDYVEGQLLNV